MCWAVSVFRGGGTLQPSQRWLYKETVSTPSSLMLNKVSATFSPAFFPAAWSNPSCNVHGNHNVAAISPRSNSFQRLLSPSVRAQTAGRTETGPPLVPFRHTSSTGFTFSPTVSPIGLSPASLTLTSPLLSGVPSCHRLFASKTTSSSPFPVTRTAGASEQLTVQAGEQQASHEVEKRHGDELKNFYHMPSGHHDDPRHINPDGTLKFRTTAESFHWENDGAATPAQQIVSVNGKKMIKGVETRDFVELFQIYQKNIPFWPRARMSTWGNHDLLMKAEFLFFWVPTFIIWSLAVPMFTMLYMGDEAIYASMTVKVIGRQWYWIYEIESPVDEDE